MRARVSNYQGASQVTLIIICNHQRLSTFRIVTMIMRYGVSEKGFTCQLRKSDQLCLVQKDLYDRKTFGRLRTTIASYGTRVSSLCSRGQLWFYSSNKIYLTLICLSQSPADQNLAPIFLTSLIKRTYGRMDAVLLGCFEKLGICS